MVSPQLLTAKSLGAAFVLPADAVLIPARELKPGVRRRIGARVDDYALSRPAIRTTAKLVDSGTAALLGHFRSAATIVDAVVKRSRETGGDPRALLRDSYETILRFIEYRLLVPVDENHRVAAVHRRKSGDVVGGWVLRSTIQVIGATEVYFAKRAGGDQHTVVLKLAAHSADGANPGMSNEAAILMHINGGIAPRFLDAGKESDFDFVVMEWRRGVDAARAASDFRSVNSRTSSPGITRLAVNIADAYAALHQRGIIHGDVHEGNVLIDRDGSVTLIDFELSSRVGTKRTTPVPRGGRPFYYEPEFANASLSRTTLPAATFASDQYALAAMLYQIITGAAYLNFELDEPRAFAQIVSVPMVGFAQRGVTPAPKLEAALARALSKSPRDRFASVSDFAVALRAATSESQVVKHSDRRQSSATQRRRTVVESKINQLQNTATRVDLPPPTASVMFGAAGIAYMFYRLSLLNNDASLLSVANAWSITANGSRRRHSAFYDHNELRRGTFGHASLYYGTAGVDIVQSLIGIAMGDFQTVRTVLPRLGRLPAGTGSPTDLALGLPGALIGLTQLLEALPAHPRLTMHSLIHVGDQCAALIQRSLALRRPIAEERVFVNLGIAHGWAGALYALMRWHQATGSRLSSQVRRRLIQLAQLAEPAHRGLQWPWRDVIGDPGVPPSYMSGWCNGSAGFVHLWLIAHELFREEQFIELAEGAAWDASENPESRVYDLCCGRAGRAYALLALYRATGANAWLDNAQELANDAMDLVAKTSSSSVGLFKGATGVLLLQRELEQPHLARMPLFEREGWPQKSLRKKD